MSNTKSVTLTILIALLIIGFPYAQEYVKKNPNSPETRVRQFLEASQSGDPENLKPHVTYASWEMSPTDLILGGSDMEHLVFSGEIKAVVPAQVTLDGGAETVELLLRQENKKWLIYGYTRTFEGSPITVNFEDPEQLMNDLMGILLESIPDDMPEEMKKEMIDEIKKEFSSSTP